MKNIPENLHVKALSLAGTLFLVILSILAIVATVFVFKGQRSYDENTISVSGTAEVSGAPDIATFSFTVSEVANNPEEAQGVISKKVDSILAGLNELNISDDDIQTDSYTINPRYEWSRSVDPKIAVDGTSYIPEGRQVLIGYDVQQSVSVTLRDLDRAAEALTLFAAQGVENLYGPQFEIDEPEALEEQARLEAIADAKAKAERLAKDLGVKLGKIVSFSEGGNGYYPMANYARSEMAFSMDSAGSAPELPTGMNDITSNVTIVYTIK